jgi:hypothetical protein
MGSTPAMLPDIHKRVVNAEYVLVSWSFSGQPYVTHSGTYEAVSDENFAEMVEFLIDYAMRVSEAYIPKAVSAK